ncbi:MAG: helix-turn-helix domain-containing protein [Dactylosporangium sp.]|nr:helix-turn-helix domain-containing protein [Dactylosporangium sp.]NNJ62350.1 helix-turn-helix domain-containing protein [Dactylosporangium sp.]
MPVTGPTVVRRQLGRRLRKLREAAGRTEIDVENAQLASRTKVWRIETGKVPVKVPDIWALCRFYGVPQEETDSLASLASATSEQGWWEDHAGVVPTWFKLYVGMEGVASGIHIYEGGVVPGEVQTADYARALWRAAWPDLDDQAIEPNVAVRLNRQRALLGRTPPPQISILVGEGALARQVGGAAVMEAQIAHLREVDQLDHIEIKVLTFASGAHPGLTGAFRVLDFDDPEDPNVVYIEAQVGGRYLEKPAELAEYRRMLGIMNKQAVPLGEYPS